MKVLITGVSGGIGKALAQSFIENGHEVWGIDLVETNDSAVNFFRVDLANTEEVLKFCSNIASTKFDVLINNAAMQLEKTLKETSNNEWDNIFNVNLKSNFILSKEISKNMPNGSSIINISSIHSNHTTGRLGAYSISKGAIDSLTQTLALELAPRSIRVNSILPGAIDTEMLRENLKSLGDEDKLLENLKNSTPLNKIGSVDDISRLALFLSDSNQAGFITGAKIMCDGGASIKLATE